MSHEQHRAKPGDRGVNAIRNDEVVTLKVAAVQLTARVGRIDTNNRHATPFIEEAAKRGAKLVVLPEMYSSGYLATAKIWEVAENGDGPTSRWLKETARRLGIYLGTGLVETNGADFYNAYAISDPDGHIVGTCRKNYAEAYAFKRGNGPHVFETPFGRIGVGICADNQFAFLPGLMHEESVDIMLMPHAAPLRKRITLEETSASNYRHIELQYTRMKNLPHLYAKMLGIPVVFVTQVGTLEKLPGIVGIAMNPEKWCIPGISRIVDSDDATKAELGDVEDFALADVTLDPVRKEIARRQYDPQKSFNGFSAFARSVIFPVDGIFARRSYRNSKRKWKEGHLSGNHA